MINNKEQVTQNELLETEDSIESLIGQIKHHKKRLFLEKYPTFEDVSKTAEAIHVGRSTVYHWMRNDKDFLTVFEAVKAVVELELLEKHEKDLNDISFDPKTPANVRVLAHFFMLKALKPEKYREKTLSEHRVAGNIIVHSAIPRPKYIEADYTEVETPKEIESAST